MCRSRAQKSLLISQDSFQGMLEKDLKNNGTPVTEMQLTLLTSSPLFEVIREKYTGKI